jgi:hypothetical protein
VSLYTCLNLLNKPGVNISTAEDPSEINMPGVNQVNVNEKAGSDFAAALKSFLRQDPDVIMVGEIRDLETADISIKAAQTGHMVLSTLHTNDAPTTLTRMRNMGIAPFNIASSVILITAQRLARRLCMNCKAPADIPRETLLDAGFGRKRMSMAAGRPIGPWAAQCATTAIKAASAFIRSCPSATKSSASSCATAVRDGHRRAGEGATVCARLRESGLLKVRHGNDFSRRSPGRAPTCRLNRPTDQHGIKPMHGDCKRRQGSRLRVGRQGPQRQTGACAERRARPARTRSTASLRRQGMTAHQDQEAPHALGPARSRRRTSPSSRGSWPR